MTKTTPEQNKAIVLEAFETCLTSATTPPPSGSGPITTSSTAPTSRRAVRGCSTSSARHRRRCAMRTN